MANAFAPRTTTMHEAASVSQNHSRQVSQAIRNLAKRAGPRFHLGIPLETESGLDGSRVRAPVGHHAWVLFLAQQSRRLAAAARSREKARAMLRDSHGV